MLRDARVRLSLTSATLLFVELLLIRWVPVNVVYVGFFKDSDAADLAFGASPSARWWVAFWSGARSLPGIRPC